MNRDHVLFALLGTLGGFIAGYLAHEWMSVRQPARVVVGPADAAALAGGPAPDSMEEIRRLREHVERNPQDADAILLLANLNYDIGGWARAQELYERYLALRPGNPGVLTDLGTTLRAQQRFDLALARFAEAQAIDPNHWESRFNEIVVLAFDLADPPRARAKLPALLALQPENPTVTELAREVERLAGPR